MSKQKLELVWVGKEKRARLEPRILIEDPAKSYHAAKRVSNDDIFDNMLIHGDNLLALKALEQEYAGKVKCIYIDPPYNTGNAFEHYDDGIEHSLWLSLMRDRLELLHNLLSDDGSIWINLDDNESHYCKVLCDELFGRCNFVANVIWQKKYSPSNDAKWLSDNHDHILVYAKNKNIWRPNLLPRSDEMNSRYKNPDNDPRGLWKPGDISVKTYTPSCDYPITTPSGRIVNPPKGYCWRFSKEKFAELVMDNRIWFGSEGKSVPAVKRFLTQVKDGITSLTVWTYQEVGHNQDAKKEVKSFNDTNVFSTPKPERLIERILTLGSNKGDLVLDSFLGSGTTAAVAHKMGRRWIGIELGDHCDTHCAPRLKKVIDGEDQGGITKSVNWQGGGGFRYYNLAPSLIKFDEWGNPVINKQFDEHMLVRALCKIEGFDFDPSPDTYWKQGKSTETDFIYITTQHLTAQMLTKLNEDVGQKNSLLICCGSFDGNAERYGNLTIKKIPKAILKKCEWNHDDYSLEIKNLPFAEPTPSQPAPAKKSFKKQKADKDQLDLFGENK
jgi:adenine-specific DNA-methyltransferase